MKTIQIFFFIISSVCFTQKKLDKLLHKLNHNNIPYITVKELAQKKDSLILLDAREKKEFDVSHIRNATFVGYKNFDLTTIVKDLPKDKSKTIVVYCSLGVRSEKVAKKLKDNGYTNIYNLYGGIFEWKNKNYKVQDTLGKTTEKVHAFNKKWSKWLRNAVKIY